MSDVKITYTGGTPGADTDVYPILNSVDAGWPARFMALDGQKRVIVDIAHSEAFDIAVYKSGDRGESWELLEPAETIAAPTDETTVRDYLVGHLDDFKIEVTNGGVAQDPWIVDISLTTQRVVAD